VQSKVKGHIAHLQPHMHGARSVSLAGHAGSAEERSESGRSLKAAVNGYVAYKQARGCGSATATAVAASMAVKPATILPLRRDSASAWLDNKSPHPGRR
jgi:hypothetical protein